jgi:PhnB protein
MATLSPYINFNDNCEEAFTFYKSVFGGEFSSFSRFKEMPPGMPMEKDEENKVLHVALPISKETVLMGSDIPKSTPASVVGTNLNISINAESEKEADKLFNGLAQGGNVIMPIGKTFWGAYFGMLTDKFRIQWMVTYTYPDKQ